MLFLSQNLVSCFGQFSYKMNFHCGFKLTSVCHAQPTMHKTFLANDGFCGIFILLKDLLCHITFLLFFDAMVIYDYLILLSLLSYYLLHYALLQLQSFLEQIGTLSIFRQRILAYLLCEVGIRFSQSADCEAGFDLTNLILVKMINQFLFSEVRQAMFFLCCYFVISEL